MCLIALAYRSHPEYPLIVTANRDEFYSRETQQAHWWDDYPHLLAGKDLAAGGTWMGINRGGLFAAVTNVREPNLHLDVPGSRGELPRDYLTQPFSNEEFLNKLVESKEYYQGYNLFFGSINELWFISNRSPDPVELKPGLYGLSNGTLDTPWPKVESAKSSLNKLLASESIIDTEQLLQTMSSTIEATDEELPSTGVSLEWERRLSAIRIISKEYGTRSSTALLIDKKGKAFFHERTLTPHSGADVIISFEIERAT